MKNTKYHPMAVKQSDINKRTTKIIDFLIGTFYILLFISAVGFLGTVLSVGLIHPKYL